MEKRGEGAVVWVRKFVYWALPLILLGCAAAPEPVSIPVPFAGSLTSDTGVAIAEGTPLGAARLSFIGSSRGQVIGGSSPPQSWALFDPDSGASLGTLSFFPGTITGIQTIPFANDVRRSYSLETCAALGDNLEVCSNNFQCFEYPTDVVPNFSASAAAPDDPGAQAVVRVLYCSGNINSGTGNFTVGQLVTGKLLMGMAKLSNGDFRYFSQIESSLLVQGVSSFSGTGNPEGNVVMTLLTQGASSHTNQSNQLVFPILPSGSVQPVGTEVLTILSSDTSNPDLLNYVADLQFTKGNSSLIAHNAPILLHRVPELDDIFKTTVQKLCPNDPGCTPEFLQNILNGQVFLSTVEGKENPLPISCDDTTGEFQQLCLQFGSLNLHHRCAILFDRPTLSVFQLEGAWIFTKP